MMSELDDLLIRAYRDFNHDRTHAASTEDITCDPEIRQSFLDLVHERCPDVPEATILRRLSSLRKASRLPCLQRSRS